MGYLLEMLHRLNESPQGEGTPPYEYLMNSEDSL